jgi:hypothetical protein
MLRAVATVVLVAALAHTVFAEDVIDGNIVFARGTALIKADARGKGETTLATLPAKSVVRALRTDANGKILLADINGTWSWLPLDGSTKALTELPCDAGPAQLAEDGLCVLCRARQGAGTIIVTLKSAKVMPVDVPAVARITGVGAERRLVWADKSGVWSASPADPKDRKQVAKAAPLRGFLPSPDGGHALGVYTSEVFEGNRSKVKKPADVLMVFGLDGEGARRKAIQNGVPVEWSHDGQWVLVQDKASACVMLAEGGQYKCWRGYTAASISDDGKYALVLGNRDKKSEPKKKKKKKGKKKKEQPPPEETPADEQGPNDAEHGPEEPIDDVVIAPPTGPQSLYRVQLEGAYTASPKLVTKVVDGAAVWIP